MLSADFLKAIRDVVGPDGVSTASDELTAYAADASKCQGRAEAIVRPATTNAVAGIAGLCDRYRVPLTVRGGGTGYTGGSVPARGGVVLSMERFTRILEIDEVNLLAVVEPNVVTGDLQRACAAVGLFYPPDPASLNQCVIGGNVAECAGGPRAFKYGTTERYVLGLEAVLPTGEIIRTGGKTVKNVVGYDLTHTLVGSEGTLAIITQVILRLLPLPPTRETIQATFERVEEAVQAVIELVRARVVPAALELIDAESLAAVARHVGDHSLAPAGTGALLLLEVDGLEVTVREEASRIEAACRRAGAVDTYRAADDAAREELWRVRRELSPALKTIADLKINHDVVVPKARIPDLFACVARLRKDLELTIACFGHVGDGNIHVNIMVDPDDAHAVARAGTAERALFEEVVRLEGAISGEHGIGLAKRSFMPLALSDDEMALMIRLKATFDPHGILNPGKIFPTAAAGDAAV